MKAISWFDLKHTISTAASGFHSSQPFQVEGDPRIRTAVSIGPSKIPNVGLIKFHIKKGRLKKVVKADIVIKCSPATARVRELKQSGECGITASRSIQGYLNNITKCYMAPGVAG